MWLGTWAEQQERRQENEDQAMTWLKLKGNPESLSAAVNKQHPDKFMSDIYLSEESWEFT